MGVIKEVQFKDMNKIKELRKEKNSLLQSCKRTGDFTSMLTNYENGNGTPRDEIYMGKAFTDIWSKQKSRYGLTTDIETANKVKPLKVVVDMSQPVSIQPKKSD